MKKTKIDRSIDTEALGFQVRESYKTARTNIAYSIFKKGCKKVAFTSSTKGEGKTVNFNQCCICSCSAGWHKGRRC